MTALAIERQAHAASEARLEIDIDAIRANVRLFAERLAGSPTSPELMAVVKADGFGHGAAGVARAALASGATWLGVTTVTEALALRDDGLRAPVLSWLNAVDADFATAVSRRVDLGVPSAAHLRAIAHAARRVGVPAKVHLQVDVGMARDGASRSDWPHLVRAAASAQRRGDVVVVGVMGHLGCADSPDDACNERGREAFASSLAVVAGAGLRPRWRHLAATAATLTDPRTHYDLCRIGAGLVGIDPSGTTALHSALTLTAPVISVRDVAAGTRVGYGHAHTTARRTRLALLRIGYADGLPRCASEEAWVRIRGEACRIVGRISMDQTVVDVGDLRVQPGDAATIFGSDRTGAPSVAQWARWAGTIPHEIVTGIGPRVERSTTSAPRTLRSVQ